MVVSREMESGVIVALVGGQRPSRTSGGMGIGSAKIGLRELRVIIPRPTGEAKDLQRERERIHEMTERKERSQTVGTKRRVWIVVSVERAHRSSLVSYKTERWQ
jgi:hypothetical protein